VEVVSGTHRLIDAMRERFNLIWLAVEKNVLDLRCKGFVNGYRSRNLPLRVAMQNLHTRFLSAVQNSVDFGHLGVPLRSEWQTLSS
jgi:hypothetical protein